MKKHGWLIAFACLAGGYWLGHPGNPKVAQDKTTSVCEGLTAKK